MSYGTPRTDTLDALRRGGFVITTDGLDDEAPFRLDVLVDGALDEQFDFDAHDELLPNQSLDLDRLVRVVHAHVLSTSGREPQEVEVSVYDPRPYPPEELVSYAGEDADDDDDERPVRQLIVTIETRGAAFDDGFELDELERLLRTAAVRVAGGVTSCALLDVNGNKVGGFYFVELNADGTPRVLDAR